MVGGLAHDVQVVLVLHQALQQVFPVAHHHCHLDARVGRTEAAQQLGHGVFHGGEDGQFQAAFFHALQGRQVLRQALHAFFDVCARIGQRASGGGEEDFFAQLLEQGLAHGVGQLFDLQRQRGRRQVQGFSRTGKTVVPGHGQKNAQLVQGGVAQVHGCNLVR